MKKLVLVVWMVLGSGHSQAQMTVKQFAKTMADGNPNSVAMTKQLVLGMGAGIQIANVFERKVKAPALYCAPEKFALNADNLIDIIKRTIADAPPGAVSDDAPISLVLLSGLAMTFPCRPN